MATNQSQTSQREALADATAKYSTSRAWQWQYENDNPRLTTHFLQRWNERTPPGAVSPETAWDHAVGIGDHLVEYFEDSGGQVADEVRLYHGQTSSGEYYTPLFIVCGSPEGAAEYHVRTTYQLDNVADPRVAAGLMVTAWTCSRMHADSPATDTPTDHVPIPDVLVPGFTRAFMQSIAECDER